MKPTAIPRTAEQGEQRRERPLVGANEKANEQDHRQGRRIEAPQPGRKLGSAASLKITCSRAQAARSLHQISPLPFQSPIFCLRRCRAGDHHQPHAFLKTLLIASHNLPQTSPHPVADHRASNPARSHKTDAEFALFRDAQDPNRQQPAVAPPTLATHPIEFGISLQSTGAGKALIWRVVRDLAHRTRSLTWAGAGTDDESQLPGSTIGSSRSVARNR